MFRLRNVAFTPEIVIPSSAKTPNLEKTLHYPKIGSRLRLRLALSPAFNADNWLAMAPAQMVEDPEILHRITYIIRNKSDQSRTIR